MKRILIVEDKPSQQSMWADLLAKYKVEITAAYDLDQADNAVDNSPPFDLVVVDGCVPGDNYNTGFFIGRLQRQKFAGHIVAAAASESVRAMMLLDGCNDETDKHGVPEKVVKLLNLTLR